MTKPKVPESIHAYLREIGLVLWACQHPLEYDYTVGGQKGRGRSDTTRVIVQLAGPGIDNSPHGYGVSVLAAVNDALRNLHFRQQRPGLNGATAKLEIELGSLSYVIKTKLFHANRPREIKHDPVSGVTYGVYDDLDDDIPF